MSNSKYWLNYSALIYTKSLLQELVTAGTINAVTLDPTTSEFKSAGKIVYLYPMGSEAELNSDFPPHVSVRGAIGMVVWGGKSTTEETVLAQERLAAVIRDKITEDGINSGGYLALDPPVQVEGLSILEETIVSREREIAGTVIKLEFTSHG